jgi:hypothetical protein
MRPASVIANIPIFHYGMTFPTTIQELNHEKKFSDKSSVDEMDTQWNADDYRLCVS